MRILAVAALGLTVLADPVFDVVSVKPSAPGGGPALMRAEPGGRFRASRVTAIDLIASAYDLQPFQLAGAPRWASTTFDIVAKAPIEIAPSTDTGKQKEKGDKRREVGSFERDAASGPSALQLMMRAMLADRFGLKAHTETRPLPIYELVPARGDRRLGPRLTRSTADCAAETGAGARAGKAADKPAAGIPRCGVRETTGSFSAGAVSMAQIAESLSGLVGRTVVDRTGLDGNWSVELRYTPDRLPPPDTLAAKTAKKPAQAIDPDGPSIFTALREQLGLKLQATKGPVSVLVIDRLEVPKQN
jgi:bla regulator protein blaR1